MTNGYAKWVQLAAIAAICVAGVLMVMKLFAWWNTGSVSLLASLLDSILDMAASLVNLLVIRYAVQPADNEHSFGHGKAESLAALAQAAFISGSAIFLILNGVERLMRPEPLQSPELGLIVSSIAVVITAILILFQKWVIAKTDSQAIKADSLHYQTDLYMNIAIIIALGLSWFGWLWSDSVFAILIGFYILFSAGKIGYDATQSLLDRQLPFGERDKIIELTLTIEGVQGLHDLRTRQSGAVKFIQLHLELDDYMPLIEAHKIADSVEAILGRHFVGADIIIHQDPLSVLIAEKEND
ncbi:CDF family cation-efflux transporter FieF [Vibrio sp. SS-MA-C1-2]|uniref:CDF family cation-efflux transporter FieF n=1 Tax=Vibrio sp. SS-MA-C1-2 TaxID=2908646 RepID=UPI001EEC7038|nr:CDF family cation-efflux transporter FieF [Vibrio sp. SS-MA-C1-2]UJF19417.1 CDF family cation-efflux transporter FieF [Vibrio sp. SS-MA-C1-2]